MPHNSQEAERRLQNILSRVRAVNYSLQEEVLEYRRSDRIVSEEDEYKTMHDIRYYVLKSYRELDRILTELDRYQ